MALTVNHGSIRISAFSLSAPIRLVPFSACIIHVTSAHTLSDLVPKSERRSELLIHRFSVPGRVQLHDGSGDGRRHSS